MKENQGIDWQDKVIIGSVVAGSLVIAALLIQPQSYNISQFQNTSPSALNTTGNTPLNTTGNPSSAPEDTIVRYYQLATSNKQEAIQLLSEPWRRREAQKGTDNWWDSIRKIEVYYFETFAKNNSQAKVKVWLKYHMKNGQTPCESLIFNLIFDGNRNTWLMDSVESNSVLQNPYCDRQ
ncbi:MAG: hypothetical protein ACRCU2_22715 [Planktothrix sp.]